MIVAQSDISSAKMAEFVYGIFWLNFGTTGESGEASSICFYVNGVDTKKTGL